MKNNNNEIDSLLKLRNDISKAIGKINLEEHDLTMEVFYNKKDNIDDIENKHFEKQVNILNDINKDINNYKIAQYERDKIIIENYELVNLLLKYENEFIEKIKKIDIDNKDNLIKIIKKKFSDNDYKIFVKIKNEEIKKEDIKNEFDKLVNLILENIGNKKLIELFDNKLEIKLNELKNKKKQMIEEILEKCKIFIDDMQNDGLINENQKKIF